MQLTLTQKKDEAPDVVSFLFKPDQEIHGKAGQFFRYIIDDPTPDERRNYRFFTNANAPFEQLIKITTRFVPGDGSTFKRDLQKLNIGDSIQASGPSGDFIIEDPNKDYVFIAGGIGITPFRSIIIDLDQKKAPVNITLLYANRTADFIFKSELEDVVSRHPEFKIKFFVDPQRIDETALKQVQSEHPSAIYYISGPEPMVEAFEKMVYSLGIPEDENKVKRDYFPGYTGL